jgi:hypothetical protein
VGVSERAEALVGTLETRLAEARRRSECLPKRRSGKPSRTRNSSSFQAPRRIFTLSARHCELNGPNLVSLSPLSRAEIHAEAAERAYEVKGPVLAGLWSATIPICVGDK